MILPDYLAQDADGYIHLAGHRIGLKDLVFYYNESCSAEELREVFPTLPLAMVHKVLAFCQENTAEVDLYMAACDAEMEKQRAATPRGPDRAELRPRLTAKLAASAE